MKRRLALAVAILLAIALPERPASALTAGLRACNKTGGELRVAVAVDCNYSISGCRAWSKGWWTIEPGACATLIPSSLSGLGDANYYYYAEGRRLQKWSGNATFCVDPRRSFEFQEGNAGPGWTGCGASGATPLAKEAFKQIPVPATGAAEVAGYTFTIP